MRDYLNNSEQKEMVILATQRNLVDNFDKGTLLTKEEKTKLKRGSSTIKNVLAGVINRLGEREAKKFVRCFESSKVIVVTDSELKVLQKRKSAELDAAYDDNKEYFELTEIVMDMNCKNCMKNHNKCSLCEHLTKQEVIPMDESEDLNNCKYAYREFNPIANEKVINFGKISSKKNNIKRLQNGTDEKVQHSIKSN